MKKAAVILSRPFKRYLGADYVICADAGYLRAKEIGLSVDLLVGDMDSLGEVPKGVASLCVPKEKDFSDGEMAIRQAALKDIYSIDIYGAIGGRLDHTLYNLHLLSLAHKLGMNAVLRGEDFDIYFTDKNLLIDTQKGDILSIVPFSEETHIIKAKGLKYSADGAILTKSDTLGLSNECTGNSVLVSIKEGSALLIHYSV